MAFEAIKYSRPDLVLFDTNMPGMDGFELLEEIRVSGLDDGGRVRVIAISAFYLRQIQSVCIRQIFGNAYQTIHPREISGKQFLAFLFWRSLSRPLAEFLSSPIVCYFGRDR
jgi:CheY-like chemotaxis protein